MKVRMNKYICKGVLTIMAAVPLASCNDFLTIMPLNEVVLENYWTEEADVNSCVYGCYAQLISPDCLERMLVWGELRSDNLTANANAGQDLTRITEENLLETNAYTNWLSFYQCINRCNTVIHYAPMVQEKDPNYTEAEMKAHIAEVTTLRSLCYFYLIRTFRDVPYVTEPSIDDNVNYRIPATKFDDVLSYLINDLENVKNDAVRSYGENSTDNMTRITRWGIYALLADLYLWKGDYQRSIDYCDLIIDYKIDEYEEMLEEQTSPEVELYGIFPLISEAPNNATNSGTAYTRIFGDGLSFESIFELNFVDDEETVNSLVNGFYGSTSNAVGALTVPSYIYSQVAEGTNKYFRKTDCRFLENMKATESAADIRKYVTAGVSFKANTTTGGLPTVEETSRNRMTPNWIVYRLTDVMLMKAEAEVMLAGDVEEGATLTEEQTAHYRTAFSCVSAVWRRANNKRVATTDTLVYSDYATSRLAMENLVMQERQRELMFEGKRWFDLVRLSRRDGNNTRMLDLVIPKFKENTVAIRIQLASPDALYFPYYRNELDANPYLVQNPAYENENITTTE